MTTFTALLCAAQSAELASPGTKVHQNDAIVVPDALATKRRLRNRVSCRKTRLKRKLYQHSLEVLARERHKRHKYLTQLYLCLGSHPDRDNALFREFATTSLHYALVDAQYTKWLDAGKDQVTLPCRSTVECDDDEYDHLPTRKCKRTRRVHDNDVSTAPGNNSRALQTSLVEQWRLIVDGLQNIDLQLHRMDEHEIATGIVDRHCYWKFVGVSSAKMKRFGEIAAVAVSGITRVRFHNHHVEEVNISNVRREDNVPFDCNISCNNTNEAC
ncbi:unnamed protein product [Peronospora belbahrii]|uniref:BZIP domain-containing protein n=1 Tax=Peronospora belbahrii TaxID=622444 RepID=A0AAU9LDR9_9STRA|nr:unnamed protein product [Peronospora belbahrii]CAH0521932.1 unnamed protein product [Peronospora belbahrii]